MANITRRSRSFVSLTGTFAATLLRPLSTALCKSASLWFYGCYRRLKWQPRNRASVLGVVEGLVSVRELWEVSALSTSVLVRWLRPLGHINPGAIGWCIAPGGSVPVGMGRFETGKVQKVWFLVLFLYLLGLVRNLISITRC